MPRWMGGWVGGAGAFLARLVCLGGTARCRFGRSQKGLSQRRVLQVFIMPAYVRVCVCGCGTFTSGPLPYCRSATPHGEAGGGTHVCAHLARLMYDT